MAARRGPRASRGRLRVERRDPGAREVHQDIEEVIEPAVVEVPQALEIVCQHDGQPRPGAVGIEGGRGFGIARQPQLPVEPA